MPGFPIRTSSDHSSVDSSPRPIAASHVLHRLLMPRHPPCALTHLFTTRCSHPLCNTQHTTTHPSTTTTTTPTIPHHERGEHRCVRRPTRAATRETTHPHRKTGQGRVSSQDPTACQAHHDSEISLCSTQPHPTHPHNNRGRRVQRCGHRERRTTHTPPTNRGDQGGTTSPLGETP